MAISSAWSSCPQITVELTACFVQVSTYMLSSLQRSSLTTFGTPFSNPLLQLKKFPNIPVSTREEARESRPHAEVPRFRLLAREEVLRYKKGYVQYHNDSFVCEIFLNFLFIIIHSKSNILISFLNTAK